jgi:hypothetical protein
MGGFMSRAQTLAFFLGFIGGFLTNSSAMAAAPMKFGSDTFHVIPAREFLDTRRSPNGARFIQIDVNKSIRWPILSTREAMDFARAGFQIRFFRLQPNGSVSEFSLPIGPCHIFITSRWTGLTAPDGTITAGALGDPSWLTANPGKQMTPGRWLMVFENLKDDNDVLRLNDQGHDLTNYIDMGIVLVVTSERGIDTDGVPPLSAEDLRSLRHLQAVARENSPAYACMELVRAATNTKLAELQACGRPAGAAGGGVVEPGAVGAAVAPASSPAPPAVPPHPVLSGSGIDVRAVVQTQK